MIRITLLLQCIALLLLMARCGALLSLDTAHVTAVRRHRFRGVGGALTHSAAFLIQNAADPDAVNAVLDSLYGAPHGCTASSSKVGCYGAGMTVLRLPIGTSDFSVTHFYSYDDVPPGEEDWTLSHFTTAADEVFFIPALKRILRVLEEANRPRPLIVAAPWSAPAWMKTSATLLGGELRNSTRIIEVYASYLVRYIQEYYIKYNITIDAITMQNEPWNSASSYPTMKLYPSQEAALALEVDRLLTAAAAEGSIPSGGEDEVPAPEIWLWDHNWRHAWYPSQVFSNMTHHEHGELPARVTGVAFHCYRGSVDEQSLVQAQSPAGHNRVFFTECSGGQWSPSFNSDLTWDVQNLVVGVTQNWGETILKWNLALDAAGGPKIAGGCMNCRGIVTLNITAPDNSYVLNEDYYTLAHVGAFVAPGDHVLAVNDGGNKTTTAFASSDGSSVIVVIVNPSSDDAATFALCVDRTSAGVLCGNVTLPAASVATIVLNVDDPSTRSAAWWLTSSSSECRLQRQPPLPFM